MKVNINESQKNIFLLIAFLILIASSFAFELIKPKNKDNKTIISFWHYWSGTEKEPIEALVEKFNKENHGFKVEILSISMPRKKILTAIVGNVAPDLVHLDGDMVTDFALRNALQEIDMSYFEQNEFIPIFLDALNINNKQWAFPFLGGSEAMHLNKSLLNKYQLETPKTLEDIEIAFAKSLETGDFPIFLPSWPSWFSEILPFYFGGNWIDGEGKISANSKENLEAWQWIEKKFISKIPADKIMSFSEGFGAYQSPDNPFYSGKIGIEVNGVWEKNLASIYAKDLDVEIAAFPGKVEKATLIRVDSLAIPKNTQHKKEALKFIQWLAKKENAEYIALAQKKITTRKHHSECFFREHENKFISIFIDLAQSPNARYFPKVSYSNRYKKEIRVAYDKVIRKQLSAKEALDQLQETMLEISE
jgi:multiple sugar transport system substrate-binding protein